MAKQYRVVALPGEGIGVEIVEAALKILQAIAPLKGFSVKVDYGLIGGTRFECFGRLFPRRYGEIVRGI
jgi:3-isopropylmalate dehydrogenase/3-benzylmalate dehydrogenase